MPELSLECIGDDTAQALRQFEQFHDRIAAGDRGHEWERRFRRARTTAWQEPWCAEVIAERTNGSFEFRFLRGRKDYTHANSVGSRGVYLWYTLLEGRVYWVQARESWKRIRRYYCTAWDGRIIEITEEDVRACLSGRSESTS